MRSGGFMIFSALVNFVSCYGSPGSWPNITRLSKRIVPGRNKIEDRDVGYDSVKYFVWIGNKHNCSPGFFTKLMTHLFVPPLLWKVFGPRCRTTPNNVACGGALITPWIVGTACHCMASFWGVPEKNFLKAQLANHFEFRVELYMGKLKVANFYDLFVESNAFYPHPKCKQLVKIPKYFSYDFGWITLEKSVHDSLIQHHDVTFAPAYKHGDLQRLYNYVTEKEAVCLLIGFGFMTTKFDIKQEIAAEMRHGWAWTRSYQQCYMWTTKWWDLDHIVSIRDTMSFVCQFMFSNPWGGFAQQGDSGGPITCSNRHFAVVSSGHFRKEIKGRPNEYNNHEDAPYYMFNEATIHAAFAYASDYRRDFEQDMLALGLDVAEKRKNPELRTSNQQLALVRRREDIHHSSSLGAYSANIGILRVAVTAAAFRSLLF